VVTSRLTGNCKLLNTEVAFVPNQRKHLNILPWSRVWKTHEIQLDRSTNSIRVPLKSGTKLVFLNTDIVNGNGLYACDFAPVLRGDAKSAYHYQTPLVNEGDLVLATPTVTKNEDMYTKRAVAQAQLARRIVAICGHIPDRRVSKIMQRMGNCPVTSRDLQTATTIYGPSIPGLKGRTTMTTTPHQRVEPVDRPLLRNQESYWDIMYLDDDPFLVALFKPCRRTKID
jgi:hypothetical protein